MDEIVCFLCGGGVVKRLCFPSQKKQVEIKEVKLKKSAEEEDQTGKKGEGDCSSFLGICLPA